MTILLIVIVLTAGCSQILGDSKTTTTTGTPTTSQVKTSETSMTTTISQTSISSTTIQTTQETTPTTTSRTTTRTQTTTSEEQDMVTIVGVVDGNTLEVKFSNGTVRTLKLRGVITPKLSSNNNPTKWEGIPDSGIGRSHLTEWGHKARQFVKKRVNAEPVRIVFDGHGSQESSSRVLQGYIYIGGDSLNKQLVSKGYAQVSTDDFSQKDDFFTLQEIAQDKKRGIWDFQGRQ